MAKRGQKVAKFSAISWTNFEKCKSSWLKEDDLIKLYQ